MDDDDDALQARLPAQPLRTHHRLACAQAHSNLPVYVSACMFCTVYIDILR